MAEFINVKNFGPLKSGTKKFIPIKKCSIIIGDQGSGKSTLVKLFSSMLWLEKALMRENYKVKNFKLKDFKNLLKQQNLPEEYFVEDTLIEYKGDA